MGVQRPLPRERRVLPEPASFLSTGTRVDLGGAGTTDVSIRTPGQLQSAFSTLIVATDAAGEVNFGPAGGYIAVLSANSGALNVNTGPAVTVGDSLRYFSGMTDSLFGGVSLTIVGSCSSAGGTFTTRFGTVIVNCP